MAFRARDSFRCALSILVACALFAGSFVASPVAHADPGAVVLRSGARVEGRVVAVLPGDRAIVVLPDGTSMTCVWADIVFVFDGPRLYDSEGNSTTIHRAPNVVPPTSAVPVPSQPPTPTPTALEEQPPFARHPALSMPIDPRTGWVPRIPSLAGTRVMYGFGGFFFVSGVALFITHASLSRGNDPALIALIFAPPATFGVALGGGMLARAARRMAVRRRFLPDPRSRDVYFGQRIEFGLAVALDRDAIVPRLTMRF